MTTDAAPEVVWAVEAAANPSVLRLHTMLELTKRTIVGCPPGDPGAPLDLLLVIPGVRSIELHRYLARLNLYPGADIGGVWSAVVGSLMPSWGRPVDPPEIEHDPRSFPVDDNGPRRVAESFEMAADDPILIAMFRVHGVAEAILEHGRVGIRPGRLFDWEHLHPRVLAALAEPSTS
ncbi:MAG: hypothetical protein WD556_06805 [Actinomycetota bacterium]